MLQEIAKEDVPVLELFSLKGKVAVVTGGGRGIGLQIARAYAEAGADVAIIYRTTKEAVKNAQEIETATGARLRTYRSDVRERETIASTIDQIAKDFGRLDIVVANAGVCAEVPALEYTEEQWRWNNSVNYDGVMWTAQAAGRIFKNQGHGNLIITASVSSVVCNIPQTQACYNSSKAAAAHLTRCLAVEWIDFARVNCVSPGYVNTSSQYITLDTLDYTNRATSGVFAGAGTDGKMAATSTQPQSSTAMGTQRGKYCLFPFVF